VLVPDSPRVRGSVRITGRGVFPLFLAPERGNVEIVPSAAHLFIAAIVDDVGAKHTVAVADECIRAMPFIHAEVLVEFVRYGVPRNELPAHPRLQAFDVLLRRSRCEHESGIARVEMGGMSYLISHDGACDAGMFGPTFDAGHDERRIDYQLRTPIE